MVREPASELGSITEIWLADVRQNEIIEGSHDFLPHLAGSHASRIFLQHEIATVV
jgi:hypothetical protein